METPIQTPDRGILSSAMAGDIVDLILRDHGPLKELIQTLKDGELSRSQKQVPLEKFVPLLMAHAKAEEESLYVMMKDFADLRMEGFASETEHEIADQLVQEINRTADDDEWNAKVKVLAESVERHIEAEESEILPHVSATMDDGVREMLGGNYAGRKRELDLLLRTRAPDTSAAASRTH